MRRSLLFLLTLLLLLATPAFAHDPRDSSLILRFEARGVRGSVLVPLSRLSDVTGENAGERLPGQVLSRLAVTLDGKPVTFTAGAVDPIPTHNAALLEIRAPYDVMPHTIAVTKRLFPDDPQSKTLVYLYEAGELKQQTILNDATSSLTHTVGGEAQSSVAVARQYVASGIHHIFIGPDHILFVIGLLLLGGNLVQLLKVVTAFTLAHSITLALAALNIYNPPGNAVEPLIALSIVCIGVENLIARPGERDFRPYLAFGFGLIHGFGFASVLQEFGLPKDALAVALVSFNVGVEMGQACIVLAVAPLLALIVKRQPKLTRPILVVGSVGVALMGTYWFIERVLGG